MKKILSAALAAILLAGLLSACSFELPHGPVEKQAWLDELPRHYSAVGYGQLAVNEGPDGNPLSLYEKQTAADGTESFAEREFSHGFYAHATSTLVFEELETQGFFRLETYVGINSTARTENTRASVRFFIFVDDEEAYASPVMDAWTPMEHVSLDIAGADRITLYADMVELNGNDHAVWADCKLSYFDEIGVSLVADDIEKVFRSPDVKRSGVIDFTKNLLPQTGKFLFISDNRFADGKIFYVGRAQLKKQYIISRFRIKFEGRVILQLRFREEIDLEIRQPVDRFRQHLRKPLTQRFLQNGQRRAVVFHQRFQIDIMPDPVKDRDEA